MFFQCVKIYYYGQASGHARLGDYFTPCAEYRNTFNRFAQNSNASFAGVNFPNLMWTLPSLTTIRSADSEFGAMDELSVENCFLSLPGE
ncbi:MAG: hypothetical protein PHQ97_09310 [Desulfobacterales bacterium]|nr:hypothetical protein [Desulfobacterales bacterium]